MKAIRYRLTPFVSILGGFTLLLLSFSPARSSEPDRLVPGRIIVTMRAGFSGDIGVSADGRPVTGVASVDALNRSFSVRSMSPLFGAKPKAPTPEREKLGRIFAVDFPEELPLDSVLEAYGSNPWVDRAEPVGEHFIDLAPNDPALPVQTNLDNPAGPDISAVLGWSVTTGDSSTLIAVLDTGVDWQHPDLGGNGPNYTDGNIFINWPEFHGLPGVDDDSNGIVDDVRGYDWVTGVCGSAWPGEDCDGADNDPMDFNGHGTHVSGIASAVTDNGIGIAGVGWSCKILPCRIGYSVDQGGVERGVVRMDWAAQAVNYATNMGAVSINASWSSSNSGGLGAAVDYAVAQGVVICVAAGNSNNSSPSYLGSRGDCLDVAAVDVNDMKASFSNYGAYVDVSAPGVSIYATYIQPPSTHTYAFLSGTSMAAPHVAGLCGLIKAANPTWDGSQIQTAIILGADNIDALNPGYAGNLGSGRINAAASLNANPNFLRVPDDFATIESALAQSGGLTDTIAVQGGMEYVGHLVIDKEALILGGWSADYSARDPVGDPSILRGNAGDAVVTFFAGSTVNTVLDGFEIYNGLGKGSLIPESGDYGGGVFFFQAPGILRNCVVRNNSVGGASTLGGGGGVYVWDAAATLENCSVRENAATRGAGVMVFGGSLTMIDCDVDSNTVVDHLTQNELGGGFYALDAGELHLESTEIKHHSGAVNGGGVYLENCVSMLNQFSNTTVLDNVASGDGGGIYATGSHLTLLGGHVRGNSSGLLGGGICGLGGSLVMADVRVRDNTGGLGGAAYLQDLTDLAIARSLLWGNAGAFSAGALYVSAVAGGETRNNTIYGNTSPATTPQITFINSAGEFSNNIVSDGSSEGVQITGAPTVSHTYNNVWNHPDGDFDVGLPGEGEFSENPLFADPGSGGFQLLVHSPSIDRGDTASALGDPDGSRADMGMFGGPAHLGFQPDAPSNLVELPSAGVEISWTASPTPGISYYAVYRDSVTGFTPGLGTLVDSVTAPTTSYIDPSPPTSPVYYRVSAVSPLGFGSGYTNELEVTLSTSSGESVPARDFLSQNEPNPFNPATRIRFGLLEKGRAELVIYDARGGRVRELVNGVLEPGPHEVLWDGTNDDGRSVSSGVYFYRLTTPSREIVRKMVLLE